MYDDSLIQTLQGLLNGSHAAATRRQFIGDLNTFILNHIPYAQVRLRDVQTGLISFDGPAADGVDAAKPILVWHFGGLPYPIVKAALLEYNYLRMWDGSGQTVHASMLFGFQSNEPQTLQVSPGAAFAATRINNSAATGNFIGDLRQAVIGLAESTPAAVV